VIIFGARSPIVVELEETCRRAGLSIAALVSVNGVPRSLDQDRTIDLERFDAYPIDAPFLACAFAPQRRAALFAMALARGLTPRRALIDPTAILASSAEVEAGTYINAGVIVGGVSMIGKSCLINRAVSLGHHTLLQDGVSIGPGATLAGNIHVGEGSMIGAGATVLPNIRIGSGSLVGAGSVVIGHVPENTFVAGNPAKQKPFDPHKSSLYIEDGE
jgi:sugar O-acyltransferase (sialic acid O-acetyltransferase NeuD family)